MLLGICRIGALVVLVGVCMASRTAMAETQVEMVRRVMPAVVGIGVHRQHSSGYRFGGDKEAQGFKERFKKEIERFRREGKPQWDPRRERITAEDIEVIGSGFFVTPSGQVVTAHHVIEGQREVFVLTQDLKVFQARVVSGSRQNDVALLQLDGATQDFVALSLGDSDSLQLAEPVIAIGNPFGFTFTVTSGIVSALGRSIGDESGDLIQTDAPINPGSSGGPLLNDRGQVVGINHAIYSSAAGRGDTPGFVGLAFAVPVNKVRLVLESGAAERPPRDLDGTEGSTAGSDPDASGRKPRHGAGSNISTP